ncbi:type VI secretion system protein ImpG [Andreprevotia lacus DSM 23236]|jgi:type VI secretion system protein ImpG|uniref:Type VI secretion system protein ImpG n=1 Tax=Andreprevotia lacus DSM 23236 TaxID=1121001 RepID=A0A1W1Y1A6_9NEIS|nr:type VI secretion system baseplate subunit TssF [Andreprevotia lacus]SMC29548.1 type VI secretion system protein ImpG [Andreprevotia lacus DSM 23236]
MMDARLLDYYNRELGYLRELGAEFAERYPKVAGRLGMQGIDVADPYVERLLEGFSFLTARIQLKMDAEFPRFTQRLLAVVYPNYLAPTPAMAVVKLEANLNEGNLANGFTLPAGSALRANLAKGEQTACEFRTGHAVTLWPLAIDTVRLGPPPADLPPGPHRARARSALRIKLNITAGQRCASLPLDQLVFYLAGQEQRALKLLELVAGHTVAVLCRDASDGSWGQQVLDGSAVQHEGFAADQSLLPNDGRTFQGYRLLQEYFACPARFLFFSVNRLQQALRGLSGTQFELVLLLDQDDAALERTLDNADLALNCTPVINLFPKRADRVLVTPQRHEFHLVVDRTKPLDYEVHSVTRMIGHAGGDSAEREFRPFYASFGADEHDYGAYYALRRESRLVSEPARRHGSRTAYTGSEVYISLVDRHDAPFSGNLRHLAVDTLCTNRDLPLLLPLGGGSDFSLGVSAPVGAIKVLRASTKPYPPLAEDALSWHLISHLGLNYQGWAELDGQEGAQAVRQLLNLYASAAESGVLRQIESVRSVQFSPVFRRLPVPGPVMHGRGVRVAVSVDEQAFSGDSPYLFGAVLEQFFARHVAINQFTEMTLHGTHRGQLAAWPPRLGARPVI